jgi:hypothetical protein
VKLGVRRRAEAAALFRASDSIYISV